MTMTRKDFNAIAVAIREIVDVYDPDELGGITAVAESIADALRVAGGFNANGNRRFDRDRFLLAALGEGPDRDGLAVQNIRGGIAMTVDAYEIEGHGMYWEVYVDDRYVATVAPGYAVGPEGTVLHTHAEWLAGEVTDPPADLAADWQDRLEEAQTQEAARVATWTAAELLPEPTRSAVKAALAASWPQEA